MYPPAAKEARAKTPAARLRGTADPGHLIGAAIAAAATMAIA
jgi:hypothetical protein